MFYKTVQANQMKFRYFLPLLLIVFFSCRHLRHTAKAKPIIKESSMDRLRIDVKDHSPYFHWLRAAGSVHFEDSDQEYTANISMKLHKDTLVWAAVSLLIELARADINRDSAVILVRPQHQYRVYQNYELRQLVGVDSMNFGSLQNLLFARPPFGLRADTAVLENGVYTTTFKTPYYLERMKLDATNLALQQYYYELNETQNVTFTYGDFTEVGNFTLPKKIELELHTPDRILVTLTISDYTLLDNDEAPFTVPESYKRIR